MDLDTEGGDVLLLEFTSKMALDEGGLLKEIRGAMLVWKSSLLVGMMMMMK